MRFTVLQCVNGWSAFYGPDGKRIRRFGPEESKLSTFREHARLLAERNETLEIVIKTVPVDESDADFPTDMTYP